ncbi:hypothetical protein BKP35_10165 [Anaerobacillus arseniciselenatis]|uniref:YibE/F family protein n=1 Tax=Anaerobacillus arseniciselenatis TaxID=85682 RepID=A0A1S2LK53_9BACI|nr:YibE/F family protein [Anaerobacillus arseniciselenatis]OIJ12919.1 hypothetical protein BKP35_10165 [Anaerobacillus arseniciselenatis]
MKNKCQWLLLIIFFINSFINIDRAEATSQTENSIETIFPTARVLEIVEENKDDYDQSGVQYEHQVVRAQILSGKFKDHIIVTTSENYRFSSKNDKDFWIKENEKVVVQLNVFNDEIVRAEIMSHTRDVPTFFLVTIFIALLLFFGRRQGFKALISISLTLLLIFKFMIPYLFMGHSPVYLAIITGTVVTLITFLLVSGFSKKTVAATIGTVGGLASAAVISIIFSQAMKLTGYHSDDERVLLSISNEISFDMQGILLAGIIIGALGAIMDVAISIASSMEEIRKTNPQITKAQLFTSGMNVGKDIMGTMANTLILAYVGAGLPLLITLYGYESTLSQIIHMEFLAVEILRTAAGSIGLILSIPITAFVTSILINKSVERRQTR